MTRNTKILSEKELFEKTKGIVEHAINAKINFNSSVVPDNSLIFPES